MQLIAIGYPDTVAGSLAMEELDRLGRDLVIRLDEVAVVERSEDGSFKTYTNAVITGDQPTWAMLWVQLFASLFYVPILGMTVGPALAPILDKVSHAGLDPLFEERVKGQLQPGTSALFVLVENVSPDVVVSSLDALGGTVLQSELSPDARDMLQETLHAGARVA